MYFILHSNSQVIISASCKQTEFYISVSHLTHKLSSLSLSISLHSLTLKSLVSVFHFIPRHSRHSLSISPHTTYSCIPPQSAEHHHWEVEQHRNSGRPPQQHCEIYGKYITNCNTCWIFCEYHTKFPFHFSVEFFNLNFQQQKNTGTFFKKDDLSFHCKYFWTF